MVFVICCAKIKKICNKRAKQYSANKTFNNKNKSNDITVDPVALSYRTNQRSTPEGAKVNVRYLLNLIMIFLPFGRNETTMAMGGAISILLPKLIHN